MTTEDLVGRRGGEGGGGIDDPLNKFSAGMGDTEKDCLFRQKFRLPPTEAIVDEFSCAVSKDILLHGRMYVSPGFLCFYSRIFSHRTVEVVPFSDITAIEKRNTSLFIPDGRLARLTFSFFCLTV